MAVKTIPVMTIKDIYGILVPTIHGKQNIKI
jgi:hypothetical protein